jgi:tRNA A37 threonylcarbamoyladenosine biosynthesis protein TsaE
VVAVEWFDRFPETAPREYLELRLARVESEGEDDTRRLEAIAHGPSAARLLEALERA